MSETKTTPEEPGELRFRSPIDAAGFTIIPNRVLTDPEITPHEKVLYALLRHYARQDGHCFPGQGRLASQVRCTRQHVNLMIKRLGTLGLITVEGQGTGFRCLYWIESLEERERVR